MTNTISTHTYRQIYRLAALDKLLRKALVAEKICEVNRTGLKTIESPYGNQPTTTVQTISGSYTPATYTTTDDTLTVSDEFIVSEHIRDFEETLTNFPIFASRVDEQNNSVKTAIDKYVVNEICDGANATYSTPSGGFNTAANVNVIMSHLISKVSGYQQSYKGLFLVIENTDVPGFIQAHAANGFSYADAALNNGWMTSYMGVDVYVVRTGTFADETTSTTSGSKTWTNLNHRVFGVKNVCTYAAPQGIKVEEKMVTAITGKEVVIYGYIGVKVWASIQDLVVDITLA